MVRSLALGFGLVTALAVAGSLTPAGQAMLGIRHPESTTLVTAIEDKPVAIPAPSGSIQLPVQSVQLGTGGPGSAAPSARPRPPVPQSAPQQGGPGGLAGVANILLNLPHVLDQTHVGPASPSRGPDSWSQPKPEKHSKKQQGQDEASKNKDGADSH